MIPLRLKLFLVTALAFLTLCIPQKGWALASNNIPLDSPIYSYLDKLAGFGLIRSDMKGIRPYSRAEAARLVLEAEGKLDGVESGSLDFAEKLIARLKDLLPREASLYKAPVAAPLVAANPFASARYRYVYLDGSPRSYERPVYDPGGDGVFGIGGGLRPDNPYPFHTQQHGTEGTPLLENNEGIVYRNGSNHEFRFSSELFLKSYATALIEPLFLHASDSTLVLLNKGYVKLGGGGLELEVGRDANWLGLGVRGNITLTDNARNFDLVKLSSPEPVHVKYIGDLKYSLIFSRFDRTVINGQERRPYLIGAKLSVKPVENWEIGLNLGRQAGGPGVKNGLGETLRGLIGGTNDDNTNSLAGLELRIRLPFLRNSEVYGEFSGEDSASFWPIVESYVAGVFVPRLTADGSNDFRFEYFLGNAILYTNGTFPAGYIYRGMPIGHSQGGASEDFFVRYSHWFSVRHNLALEYIHTERGNLGRVPVDSSGAFAANGIMQAVERKNAVRTFWTLPLYDFDLGMMYGWERVNNFDLVPGSEKTNQIFSVGVSYRY